MLVLQLKEMERDGLIIRTIYPQVPPRVEYKLTENAKALMPFLDQLELWGNNLRKTADSINV
jgi:DNA-binding HxlR family transcriptional regulator